MPKKIIYLLSVLVAGAAAYWSFDNKGKLEAEIALQIQPVTHPDE